LRVITASVTAASHSGSQTSLTGGFWPGVPLGLGCLDTGDRHLRGPAPRGT
jgi:hypothetical protein